jgi:hypothetical protein
LIVILKLRGLTGGVGSKRTLSQILELPGSDISFEAIEQSETTGISGPYLPGPDLRIRMASEETIRGRDFVPVHLIVPGFNVDEGEFAFVFRAEARQDFAVVDLIA